MMSRLFWVAVALAAALFANAGFTLYAPTTIFAKEVERIAGGHGPNTFFILNPKDQALLFPGLPRRAVTGLCVFDVSGGDVTLAADLPDTSWITTIYTIKGQPIYSVNNRQSGANVFNVRLSRAPGFIEAIVQSTDKEQPEIDSGWTVNSPEPKGLAVVWTPFPEAAMRDAMAAAVARSRCLGGTAAPSQ
jgi:uncharacterized membrane protein